MSCFPVQIVFFLSILMRKIILLFIMNFSSLLFYFYLYPFKRGCPDVDPADLGFVVFVL